MHLASAPLFLWLAENADSGNARWHLRHLRGVDIGLVTGSGGGATDGGLATEAPAVPRGVDTVLVMDEDESETGTALFVVGTVVEGAIGMMLTRGVDDGRVDEMELVADDEVVVGVTDETEVAVTTTGTSQGTVAVCAGGVIFVGEAVHVANTVESRSGVVARHTTPVLDKRPRLCRRTDSAAAAVANAPIVSAVEAVVEFEELSGTGNVGKSGNDSPMTAAAEATAASLKLTGSAMAVMEAVDSTVASGGDTDRGPRMDALASMMTAFGLLSRHACTAAANAWLSHSDCWSTTAAAVLVCALPLARSASHASVQETSSPDKLKGATDGTNCVEVSASSVRRCCSNNDCSSCRSNASVWLVCGCLGTGPSASLSTNASRLLSPVVVVGVR
jgi:hypothetical protein